MEGGGPSTRSSKKKKKSSPRCNRSADDSSDDEASLETKRMSRTTAELVKKEQDELLRKQMVEDMKTEKAKVQQLLKKELLERQLLQNELLKEKQKQKELHDKMKKAEDAFKRKEERKKVVDMNDPKEAELLHFNDLLAEASSCFVRNIPIKSMEKFAEALDIIDKSLIDLEFNSKNVNKTEEVVVIKYMFARLGLF